jgi:hypothetical protein
MKILWALGIVFCTMSASAQVRLLVPKTTFQSNDLIRAQVVNSTNEPITVCLEIGQRSVEGGRIESTPIPFLVQAAGRRRLKHFFRRHWGVRLIGPDVGELHVPLDLPAGKTQEFPFRLADEGPRFRLLLYYWKGKQERGCAFPPNSARKAISSEFQLTR